jgi:predicted MPP superfamily phosphohydrolase
VSARRRFSRIFRVILAITAATHATFALAATELMRLLGVSHPALAGTALSAVLFVGFLLRLAKLFPDRPRTALVLHLVEEPYFAHWCAAFGSAIPIAVYAIGKAIVFAALGRAFEPPTTFALAVYSGGLLVALWGVYVRRRWVLLRQIELAMPGLPPEFDGYRVAQLSDLHIGGLTPRKWGEAWARLSNGAEPDLVVVTGDLVSSGVDFHDDIAAVIGSLRAEDGVFVSMGNHDYFGDGEPLIGLLRAQGATVLRNEGATVKRGDASLFVAGIDDTWTRRADVGRALSGRAPGAFTLVLAHDPALFLDAVREGANLVLSGHTHGGQIALPFFPHLLSLARLTHRFYLGLYREGDAVLYVHPGLGTTGPPIRIGVAPEVAILTLRPA